MGPGMSATTTKAPTSECHAVFVRETTLNTKFVYDCQSGTRFEVWFHSLSQTSSYTSFSSSYLGINFFCGFCNPLSCQYNGAYCKNLETQFCTAICLYLTALFVHMTEIGKKDVESSITFNLNGGCLAAKLLGRLHIYCLSKEVECMRRSFFPRYI